MNIAITIMSQCTYRCVVLPDSSRRKPHHRRQGKSQCTYRCVVLPDLVTATLFTIPANVSMHLQVRGGP